MFCHQDHSSIRKNTPFLLLQIKNTNKILYSQASRVSLWVTTSWTAAVGGRRKGREHLKDSVVHSLNLPTTKTSSQWRKSRREGSALAVCAICGYGHLRRQSFLLSNLPGIAIFSCRLVKQNYCEHNTWCLPVLFHKKYLNKSCEPVSKTKVKIL